MSDPALDASGSPYYCSNCLEPAAVYSQRCKTCQAWNVVRPRPRKLAPVVALSTYEPRRANSTALAALPDLPPNAAPPETLQAHVRPTPMQARDIDLPRIRIGVGNVDAALGGGFVHGSAGLLSGGEGAGKSTMTLRMLEAIGPDALYAQTEEDQRMIEDRVKRTGCGVGVDLFCSQDLRAILSHARRYKAIIIDSLHGLIGNVDENAKEILKFSRDTKSSVLCIARLVKDGTIAGPRGIAYEFDYHLEIQVEDAEYCENGVVNGRRFIVGHKNRFGACDRWPLHLSEHGWEDPAEPEEKLLED